MTGNSFSGAVYNMLSFGFVVKIFSLYVILWTKFLSWRKITVILFKVKAWTFYIFLVHARVKVKTHDFIRYDVICFLLLFFVMLKCV